MLKHHKSLIQGLGEVMVECTCGWKSKGATKTLATLAHTEHRKATAPSYILSRDLGGGQVFVSQVAASGIDWGYTTLRHEAIPVDHATRTRFLKRMRDVGKKGHATLLTPTQ